jgi:hypothetical protein
MTIRDIAEVRTRLESAVAGLPGEPADAADLYDRYEMVATQILDSEAFEYEPENALLDLLMGYLLVRQIELGLLPASGEQEE